MVINRNNGSFPAVGVYNSTIKFYYTYGDREINPYPDRLCKIGVETYRAALQENSEYFFDISGKLIFYFEKIDDIEYRIYFTAAKPFKMLKGEKSVNINGKEEAEKLKTIMGNKLKLAVIFTNSLE